MLLCFVCGSSHGVMPLALIYKNAYHTRVLLQVLCWLLRLTAKLDFAQLLEGELQTTTAAEPSPAPRRNGRLISPHSRSANARQAGLSKAASAAIRSTSRDSAVCTNPARAAEVMKKTASGLGINLDTANVHNMQYGYGRAVCTVLQQVVDAANDKLHITCRLAICGVGM